MLPFLNKGFAYLLTYLQWSRKTWVLIAAVPSFYLRRYEWVFLLFLINVFHVLFQLSCAFSFCWFVVTLHQALNLWFLDEPYQGNWSAYPNLLSQTCEQDVVIDCIKSGAEIKYDQQSHLLTVHFHKNIIRDFDKSRFRTIILTIWWLKLGIFNNYSLKSRWIVAKYSQSH